MMSSCNSEKLCTSSTATAAVTPRSGGAPAARADNSASAGRSALPLPLLIGLPPASAKPRWYAATARTSGVSRAITDSIAGPTRSRASATPSGITAVTDVPPSSRQERSVLKREARRGKYSGTQFNCRGQAAAHRALHRARPSVSIHALTSTRPCRRVPAACGLSGQPAGNHEQQRLDPLAYPVRDDPRWLLTLPHAVLNQQLSLGGHRVLVPRRTRRSLHVPNRGTARALSLALGAARWYHVPPQPDSITRLSSPARALTNIPRNRSTSGPRITRLSMRPRSTSSE